MVVGLALGVGLAGPNVGGDISPVPKSIFLEALEKQKFLLDPPLWVEEWEVDLGDHVVVVGGEVTLSLDSLREANHTDVHVRTHLTPDSGVEGDVLLTEVTVDLVGWEEEVVENL